MKLKSLLKNKNFLYFVLFIAVVNTFGYLMIRDTKSVILFALVGLLTSYFTKNMIIVLLSAIVVTNLYAGSILGLRIKEGMENHGEEEDEDDDEDEEVMETFEHNEDDKKKKKKKNKEKMTPLRPADYPPSGKKPKLDPSGTLEAAYDHLDKLLDSGALDKMSTETQNLAAQQDKLLKNIDKLEPMLSRAEGMMNNMSKMGGVKKRLDNMLGNSE